MSSQYQDTLNLTSYDTIIMVTNTLGCLIDEGNFESVCDGAVIASLCTTSQTGKIAGTIYDREDVNVIFDYELTRNFTPDLQAADKAGHLDKVSFLRVILNEKVTAAPTSKKTVLSITGTPMQNLAVINILWPARSRYYTRGFPG